MIKKFYRISVKQVICTRFFTAIMFTNKQLKAFFESAGKKVKTEDNDPIVEKDLEFNYIVKKKEQDKICFLSGQDRYPKKEKVPITATATILSPEKCSAINAFLTKVRSKRGVGGLADLSDRFQKMCLDDTPGPTKYDLTYKKKIEPNRYPFGKCKDESKVILNKNPGPGTYGEPWQCRRPLKKYRFGGKMQLDPCVETICYPLIIDKCAICQYVCKGDYWHVEYSTFLCLRCMRLEKQTLKKFSKQELRKFKKIRNCAFMHQHEGTTAAIRILPKGALCTKFRKENYLENFFSKYH